MPRSGREFSRDAGRPPPARCPRDSPYDWDMTRTACLLLILATGCGDDRGPDDVPADTTGADETATGEGDETAELPEANCVVDLDCGDFHSACSYPHGCDGPGRCVLEEPLGECPFNPAPLLQRPDGLACSPTFACDPGLVCFYWDGRCGAGFRGACVRPNDACELVPPELKAADRWCREPTVPPGGGFASCESPAY